MVQTSLWNRSSIICAYCTIPFGSTACLGGHTVPVPESSVEWHLCKKMFHYLTAHFKCPVIDLFMALDFQALDFHQLVLSLTQYCWTEIWGSRCYHSRLELNWWLLIFLFPSPPPICRHVTTYSPTLGKYYLLLHGGRPSGGAVNFCNGVPSLLHKGASGVGSTLDWGNSCSFVFGFSHSSPVLVIRSPSSCRCSLRTSRFISQSVQVLLESISTFFGSKPFHMWWSSVSQVFHERQL